MNKYAGAVADYRASDGKTTAILYRGAVTDTVLDILEVFAQHALM